MIFNGMSNYVGLFYAERRGNTFVKNSYWYFLCYCFLRDVSCRRSGLIRILFKHIYLTHKWNPNRYSDGMLALIKHGVIPLPIRWLFLWSQIYPRMTRSICYLPPFFFIDLDKRSIANQSCQSMSRWMRQHN